MTKHTIRIEQDDDPMNPREWDNVATLVCLHSDYQLGDKHDYRPEDFGGWSAVANHIRGEVEGGYIPEDFYDNDEEAETFRTAVTGEKILAMVPLYLFDHSGLSISTGTAAFSAVDSAGWDWGQVGIAFVTKKNLLDAGFSDEESTPEKAVEIIEQEIETYDTYMQGEIYGFVIEKHETCNLGHNHAEVVDSCWGFDDLRHCLEIARENVPDGVTAELVGELAKYAEEKSA